MLVELIKKQIPTYVGMTRRFGSLWTVILANAGICCYAIL